jgi:hypothetical protein
MKKYKLAATMSALGLLFVSTAAHAGTSIEGICPSNDANARARVESAKRFNANRNCISQARVDSCRFDRGDWICVAFVANHRGSCR